LLRKRISPIQIKSGREVRAQPQLASQSVEAMSEPMGAVVNSPMRTMPTISSERATQTPLASRRSSSETRTIEARTTESMSEVPRLGSRLIEARVFGGVGARLTTQRNPETLVDNGDGEKRNASSNARLRNPERNGE